MPLSSATRLGPYEIVGPIGAGGMGEVYRAKDTRLGREVAVKVLPQHRSASPEVRSRFEREARTVSSLNHPHICTLHDVGREGDTEYLVMELIEGETLAQRIARGPLPVSEVLRIGAQIADALDRAHRAGVIHRDLKPGNVMLTRTGAKLMDFGLARATGLVGPPSSGDSLAMTQSPTIAQPLTAEGTIVGTFQYMAPEQLEGREADGRSDIWSLGCVLYEMATGRRAFDGGTQASLIGAIMRDEPRAVAALAPTSPPALERLILQCLAKDADDRWQSAGDVRRELEWILSGSSQSAPLPVGARRAPRLPAWAGLAAGGVVAAAALLAAFGPWSERGGAARLVRFTIPSPPGTSLAAPAEADLSPDGRTLVFVASDSGGTDHLYVRSLASPEARILAGTDDADLPFWSPDGRSIGFFSQGKLRKLTLDGSTPTVLCDAPDPRGGTWSPSGTIVFAPNNQGGLARVSANGGTPVPLTRLDATRNERGHRYPQFLPDGRHFLYVAIAGGDEVATFVSSIEGEKPRELCRAGSMARFAPPNHLMYLDSGVNSRQRRVFVRAFDPGSRRVFGEPQLVIDRASATNFGYANLVADPSGTLVAEHWSDPHLRLMWRDRSGRTVGVAAEDIPAGNGTLSPDGRTLAHTGEGDLDIHLRDLESGVTRRLTFENQEVTNLTWSPDGRSIAFARLFGANGWQARVKSLVSGQDSSLFQAQGGLFNFPQCWSLDGRWLIVQRVDSTGSADLWKVPMNGEGVPSLYQHTRGYERQAALSPDGHWIAYILFDDDRRALYVQSFPDPGVPYQVAVDDPAGVVWREPGRLGVATGHGDLSTIEVSLADGFRQGATAHLFTEGKGETILDVDPKSARFLVGTLKDLSSLSELEVVLDWPALLEKR